MARKGYIQIPRAAIDSVCTPGEAYAVLDLYRLADKAMYEPVKASDRFLATRWSTTNRQTRKILKRMVDSGMVRIVSEGNRTDPRVIQVLRGAEHLAEHQAEHQAEHKNQRTERHNGLEPDQSAEHQAEHQAEQITIDSTIVNSIPPKGPRKRGPTDQDVEQLWAGLSAMRKESRSGSRALVLTKSRRRQLKGRLREYSAEQIKEAWNWWLECPDEDALVLRTGWDIDTFMRPSKFDRYYSAAERWGNQEEITRPDSNAPIEEWVAYYEKADRGKVIQLETKERT